MGTLIKGKFLRRYKRFLVDVELEDGKIIVAHCTNTGSLKSCIVPGAEVMVSKANNPQRKTQFTWEMIKINGSWVGINTNTANVIAYELLRDGRIKGFENLTVLKREVKFDQSRFDIYAERGEEKIFIEVKNVTYKDGDFARFPDAITKRGQKHIQQLLKAKEQGYRVALFFIVQRTDVEIFAPAWDIDPEYSQMLSNAVSHGVEIYPLQIRITPQGYDLVRIMKYDLEPKGEKSNFC